MKPNQLTIILFFAFFFSNVNAQDFKLGKVSIAELQEKSHPMDTSAVAAILFKRGEVDFKYDQDQGFIMELTVETKIKIYKKEGYDWANDKVSYLISNNVRETVSFSDAVTYNLIGGKIEKTKLKSDGEFDEKVNKYRGLKKITMPNIKEGSIIEYKYTLRSPIIGALRDWYFQSSIPVNYSEYVTNVPEYYIYTPNQKGYVFPKVTVNKRNKSIDIITKFKQEGLVVVSNASVNKIDYQETKTSYITENLPAMKDEAFVNNIDNYMASISNELSMTNYPQEPYKTYSTNWEAVTKTIYEYDSFGPELNKTGYFEDDLKGVLAETNTQNEKIAAIFNHIKSSVKWDGYYDYSCNEGVRTAYKDKTGNVAEINLMLTAMLRYAGISANPVLLSTRSNGVALFPSRYAFNYVIAAVETPEGLILLDATEKYSVPNVLPLRDLNWLGRLIRKDGTSVEVDLMPKTLSREGVNMNIVLNSDGSVDGKLRSQLTNHEALEFRKANLATNLDNYLEELENNYNNIEISDYIRENDLDLSKPILENYSFKDAKSVEIINDKIYINPLLFLTTKENPFKQETREYPVDFGYPKQEKYNINIKIPEGFVVETIPKAINIATGENIGTFKYMISNTESVIQIAITKDINAAIVSPDFYPDLKDFYQLMIDKQNDKIVLIRK